MRGVGEQNRVSFCVGHVHDVKEVIFDTSTANKTTTKHCRHVQQRKFFFLSFLYNPRDAVVSPFIRYHCGNTLRVLRTERIFSLGVNSFVKSSGSKSNTRPMHVITSCFVFLTSHVTSMYKTRLMSSTYLTGMTRLVQVGCRVDEKSPHVSARVSSSGLLFI